MWIAASGRGHRVRVRGCDPGRRRRSRFATAPCECLNYYVSPPSVNPFNGSSTVTSFRSQGPGANVPTREPAVCSLATGGAVVNAYRALAGVVVLCVVATGNAWGQAVTGSQLSG